MNKSVIPTDIELQFGVFIAYFLSPTHIPSANIMQNVFTLL